MSYLDLNENHRIKARITEFHECAKDLSARDCERLIIQLKFGLRFSSWMKIRGETLQNYDEFKSNLDKLINHCFDKKSKIQLSDIRFQTTECLVLQSALDNLKIRVYLYLSSTIQI